MKTAMMALADLKQYSQNARINTKTVKELTKRIAAYGYRVPMVIDANNTIVAGDARYQALKNLGRKEALCVVLDIDAEKVREFRVLDNKIPELSDWDKDALNVELRGLPGLHDMFPGLGVEEDLPVAKGVTAADIVKMEKALGDQFTTKVETSEAQMVKVKCPGCEKVYSVSIKDLT